MLWLENTAVGDEGLAKLGILPELSTLKVSRTAVSDASVEALAKWPALSTLNYGGSKLTDAGIAKLKAAKPKLMAWK
jgi:hypothetical protein